jgi:hypothetical protein
MSKMYPFLISEPWGLHINPEESPVLKNGNSSSKIPGSGSPRIIAPAYLTPRYGSKQKLLPKVSFPFRWDGEICIAFQLPLNLHPRKKPHDYSLDVFLGEDTYEIIQSEVVGRPDSDHESVLGRKIDSFIEWQINCFRELAHDGATISISEMEEKSQKIMRRNWDTVRKTWVGFDKSKAFMALIVQLSQKKDLLRIFHSITLRPRHILLRYRQNTRLHRIQELDSACIRDLAKRPGKTVAEKAGPRQELLAVRRRATVETLENRVFQWVINRMYDRANDYVATNKHLIPIGTDKVKSVQKCGRKCKGWASSETLQSIAFDKLQHPIQPNYSLQMDERYRNVYRTYRKLLKEKQVRDDAWEWQRILWTESARQLVGSTLTEVFKEERASTPYYRFESEYGMWTKSPVGAGPFITKAGQCILIDSRDVLINPDEWINHPPFDFTPYLGTIGCDQILFWPLSKTILLTWFVYWTGKSDKIVQMLNRTGEALRILSSDIGRFTRKHYKCLGLMLVTDPQAPEAKPGVEIETWPSNSEMTEIVSLQIPFTIDQTNPVEFRKLIEDFRTGIQLVVDTAIGS